MKILIFVKTFANPTLTFIYNEVTELAKQHEVKIVTCERKHEDLFPFQDVAQIPFETNARLQKIHYKLQVLDIEIGFKSLSFRKKLKKVVEEFQPDVIHTHFGFESWLFLLNFKRTDIPIFVSFHGYDASHKLNSARYRQTLKNVLNRPNLHPIFVSNFMQKQVESRLEMNIPQARILYYGTDIDLFQRQRYDFPQNPFTFLQVSSFAAKKGHVYTIKAFALFLQKWEEMDSASTNVITDGEPTLPPILILAGDGPLRQAMQTLCQELGISDAVKFPGLVNQTQAKALMERSHVFVHHSVTSKPIGDMEGIPNALMEAMAMELPVISTRHSGIPELIEEGVHGFLVNEEDIKTYAQRMYEALSWTYKPQNRQKVAQQFERKQHERQLTAHYEEACKPKW